MSFNDVAIQTNHRTSVNRVDAPASQQALLLATLHSALTGGGRSQCGPRVSSMVPEATSVDRGDISISTSVDR